VAPVSSGAIFHLWSSKAGARSSIANSKICIPEACLII
jgi:hypothetical protein